MYIGNVADCRFVVRDHVAAQIPLGHNANTLCYFSGPTESAARKTQAWWKGTVLPRDLPFEIVADGTTQGALAKTCEFSAATIGPLVFGRAGSVVFGGVGGAAGILGQYPLRRALDDLRTQERNQEIFRCCDAFGPNFERPYRRILAAFAVGGSPCGGIGSRDERLDLPGVRRVGDIHSRVECRTGPPSG